MWLVCAALVPGTLAMSVFYGPGILWNVLILALGCAAFEWLCNLGQAGGHATNQASSWHSLKNGSAVLTGWLMALCCPPWLDLYTAAIAASAAIVLAKWMYGGLGRNLFNPAMVGYAVVLISVPTQLDHWPALQPATAVDGYSGATLLSEFRYRGGQTVAEFEKAYAVSMTHLEYITFAFAVGGIWLMYLRLAAWRVAVATCLGLALAALIGYDQGSSDSAGGWWMHLTAGGTAVLVFFVVTDPVTHPRSLQHQWLFGIVVGVMAYMIRTWGSYPDGLAFAVLLANCITPLLNRITLKAHATQIAESTDAAAAKTVPPTGGAQ